VVPATAGADAPGALRLPATPLSPAVHDPVADLYLISDVNRPPQVLGSDGFISRLARTTRCWTLECIRGGVDGVTLHAPTGITNHGDVLHVADADAVRLFHRACPAPSPPCPGPFHSSSPRRGCKFSRHGGYHSSAPAWQIGSHPPSRPSGMTGVPRGEPHRRTTMGMPKNLSRRALLQLGVAGGVGRTQGGQRGGRAGHAARHLQQRVARG
jgi:hypothetical protein